MVKHIQLTYDNDRAETLKKLKELSGKSWEDFIFDGMTKNEQTKVK